MLRPAVLALASLSLMIASGCAGTVQNPCTCVGQAAATTDASVQTGATVDTSTSAGWTGGTQATGTTAGWSGGTQTAGTGAGWTGGTQTGSGAGWTGGASTGAGWNGGAQAGWNGTQTAGWNGQAGGGVAVGRETGSRETGTATAGGPVFYGIPLGGAQDVIFVLDHSASMSSSDASVIGLPGSPLTALAMGMQAMQGVQLTAASATTALNPAALWSMGTTATAPSKLQKAKAELMGALATLPDGTRFNVVFFSDLVSSEAPSLMTMNPITRLQSVAFVHGIGADGETAAVPAMRTAYASRPSRVVFLSDGLANRGGTPQQLMAEARVQMRRGVRFDTVGIGPDQDTALMQALATESGGIAVRR